MNRRTYLAVAATGVVGSVAGCAGASDGSEYPPYPDSESTELSGEGPGTSESFDISLAGPTIIDLKHEGSEDFVVALDEPAVESNETTGNETQTQNQTQNQTQSQTQPQTDPAVATVANAIGPYDGRTLHSVAPNSYVLSVLQADDAWTATVYDLPEYPDDTGISLPITREDQLYDVVGPVNFGELAETDFEFDVTGDGAHQVFLVDRNGTVQQNTANLVGDGNTTATLPVAGVGYVEIRTTGSWTLDIS